VTHLDLRWLKGELGDSLTRSCETGHRSIPAAFLLGREVRSIAWRRWAEREGLPAGATCRRATKEYRHGTGCNGPAGTPACPATSANLNGVITASSIGGPSAQGLSAGEFDELVAAMRRGVTYVNVHSTTWTGGEIRGQIK
jgi:hypothetical protein